MSELVGITTLVGKSTNWPSLRTGAGLALYARTGLLFACLFMKSKSLTNMDRAMAKVCLNCPVCRRARKNQAGAAFWLVSKVESNLCPFCRAYERVYGRKSHAAANSR
jgi:hypothetical protein